MKTGSALLILAVIALPDCAHAKSKSPMNTPYVVGSGYSQHYIRCIPRSESGTAGVTEVLRIEAGGDVLVDRYEWYNQSVMLGISPLSTRVAVVRLRQDRWTRRPPEKRIELGFYLGGELKRSYTVADLVDLEVSTQRARVDEDEFHREEIADFEALGFSVRDGGRHVFSIRSADGRTIEFDADTGEPWRNAPAG